MIWSSCKDESVRKRSGGSTCCFVSTYYLYNYRTVNRDWFLLMSQVIMCPCRRTLILKHCIFYYLTLSPLSHRGKSPSASFSRQSVLKLYQPSSITEVTLKKEKISNLFACLSKNKMLGNVWWPRGEKSFSPT